MKNDKLHRGRRIVLKSTGIALTGLVGLAGPAAAHPGDNNGKGKGRGKNKNKDEDEEQGERNGYGFGRWADGQGAFAYCGRGYRRDKPHWEDKEKWGDWRPGDGKPPWAGDDDEDEDEDEDAPDEPETYDLEVVVEGPDGEPVEGASVSVVTYDGGASVASGSTDEDGEVEFEVEDGSYEVAVSHEEYLQPSDNRLVEVDGDDTEFTVTLQNGEEPEEPPEEPDEPDAPEEPEEPEEPDDPDDDDGDGGDTPEEPDEPEGPESVSAQIEARIHAETNAYREENDEPELSYDEELAEVARSHSEDMIEHDYFDHVDPEGNGPGHRLDEAGLECDGWAENIAYEFDSQFSDEDAESVADSIVAGWISSPGHERNLVGDFDSEGVGVVIEDGMVMATQVFCSD